MIARASAVLGRGWRIAFGVELAGNRESSVGRIRRVSA